MKALEIYQTSRIAIYERVTEEKAKYVVSLLDYKECFKNDNGTRLQNIRYLIYKYNQDKQATKKAKLQCYTMSSCSESKDNVADFNHILCLDFDHIDSNEERVELFKWLWNREEVLMVSKSISGHGVYALIYVAHNVEQLRECLQAYKTELPLKFQKDGILDMKCSNANRLRYDSDFKKFWKDDDAEIVPFSKMPPSCKIDIFSSKSKYKTTEQNIADIRRCMQKMLDNTAITSYIDAYGKENKKGKDRGWFTFVNACIVAEQAGIRESLDFCKTISKRSKDYNERSFVEQWYKSYKWLEQNNHLKLNDITINLFRSFANMSTSTIIKGSGVKLSKLEKSEVEVKETDTYTDTEVLDKVSDKVRTASLTPYQYRNNYNEKLLFNTLASFEIMKEIYGEEFAKTHKLIYDEDGYRKYVVIN